MSRSCPWAAWCRRHDTPDLIGSAVAAALAEHAGDVEAATAALVKRAIPDAMALLDHTRKGGRYDIVAHPWLPEILRKQTARGADQVWEARPKWTRSELPAGQHEVTTLDITAPTCPRAKPTCRSGSWNTPPATITTAPRPGPPCGRRRSRPTTKASRLSAPWAPTNSTPRPGAQAT
ncbi:hypothetical protein ACFROD_43495 [Streptomyces mirabilis]|uniref:hypothetical protein n=1 Tax=Streptomyces mirabilis TaxID=68239 RepID=UPI00369D0DED